MTEDNYKPLNAVKVQYHKGDFSGRFSVTIPLSQAETIGLEKGDWLIPVIQDGLLVYVPIPDRATPEQARQRLERDPDEHE